MTLKIKTTKFCEFILPLFGVFACLGLWEANSRLHLYHFIAPSLASSAFPSITDIGKELSFLLRLSDFWRAVGITAMRTLTSFGISVCLGVCLGLVAGRVRLIDALSTIPVEFLRNLPAVAAMPIFIIFLGIGTPMKIALCVFGAFFPVFIAARFAIQNVSEEIHIAARFYGTPLPTSRQLA